jgi:mono/diheme cytochrome c family protein
MIRRFTIVPIVCAAVCLVAAATAWTARAADDGRTTWDGIYSAAQAMRGEQIYLAKCSNCHGDSLQGDPSIGAANLVGDFKTEWDSRPVGRLFTKISTQMPGNDPGSLTPQQYADVLSFILQKNNFPAGQKDLAPEGLDQIIFEAARSKK